ncbi:ABC transporter ATP-binding protein [Porphyromonas sp.]|uniref:ABC transporter ATP-binding protein n=1 Tax=Porphyromonas sp. TaxID=1924944 RepID=UPI0026DB3EEE|nr:ABC transporter ATP-binding protein [Porphyromonas sp.]MDO4695844.1 ABC transporter ATP-binding protein [Porphyromonas sp.]MDO4771636.1 ABC transporter ATP-binding protein [Porphyromonas sp.]
MNNTKAEKKESILKRLLLYSGKKAYMLYLAMLFSALSGILILMPMVFIHRIVSGIILSGQIDPIAISRDATYAAICAAGGILLYFSALLVSHLFAFEVEQNIIKLNVAKMMSKPLGFFLNRESGHLRKVIVDGAAETHTMLAHQLPDFAMTVITPIVLLVFFFLFDWRLGLVSTIPIVVGMLLMGTMATKSNMKMRKEYYDGLSELSAEAVEYVRGIPVVKTFAQSIESFERLYLLIIKMKDLVVKWSMSFKNQMSLFEAVSSSTAFFLVPIAILIFTTGGDMREVLANSVIYLLIGPVFGIFIMRSATISNFTYFAQLALDKIDATLEYEELTYGDKVGEGEGIEFKNVSFSYGNNKVLDDISFKAEKGETVALVSASGGGKTTIARLAARFYDVDEGEVLIGGTNIKDYDKTTLMKKIAFVFQSSKLFKMSLKENLLLGKPDASDSDIEKALAQSGSKEIVEHLEKGLDTIYGTKGTYFSGGEIQRLTIARAFLKDAEFVIFDEATAFADPENEHIIQASFKALSQDRTTLMIAHRLSSVLNADKILVIDKGKIAESGTHETLLSQGGIYTKLWDEYQQAANWKIGGKNE